MQIFNVTLNKIATAFLILEFGYPFSLAKIGILIDNIWNTSKFLKQYSVLRKISNGWNY